VVAYFWCRRLDVTEIQPYSGDLKKSRRVFCQGADVADPCRGSMMLISVIVYNEIRDLVDFAHARC
jgi:hypothetical protein